MKIKARIVIFITLMFLIMIAIAAYGASIVGSKHDISTAGEEICVFCHTALVWKNWAET